MRRSSNRAALVNHINRTHTLNSMLHHEIMGEDEYQRAVERLIRYREQSRGAESERRRKRAAKAFRGYRNKFIKANMRLIMSIAMKFKVPEERHDDLIAEAVLGFDKALDKFDGSTRITTYATWWVMQGIQRYVQKRGHIVYHPVYVYEKGEVNFSNVVHIDMEDDEGKKIYDLPDQKRNPDEIIGDYERSKIIRAIIDELPERARDIVRRRFGFTDGEVQTLDSIAEKYGLTRERIRQIEKQALLRLESLLKQNSAGGLKLAIKQDPREIDWTQYPLREASSRGRKVPCLICGQPFEQGQQYYNRDFKANVHATCVHPDGKIPEEDLLRAKMPKKSPDEYDWESYPVKQCGFPQGKKYPCYICGGKILQNQYYHDFNPKVNAHTECVNKASDTPADTVKSTAVTKADEVKQPPAPKEESAPRDTVRLEEEQLEEIKGPGLLDKFPDFDENWHMEIQKRWFDCFERLAEREGE